ncbi:MAG TPA: hypothetical protein VFQ68_10965 [Streptosporangiaceae bacterium]|nr:hypothetical protein [Streptosporangiaceae bacterium]
MDGRSTPPPIAAVRVTAIGREPGHAGKYKLIKLTHPPLQK